MSHPFCGKIHGQEPICKGMVCRASQVAPRDIRVRCGREPQLPRTGLLLGDFLNIAFGLQVANNKFVGLNGRPPRRAETENPGEQRSLPRTRSPGTAFSVRAELTSFNSDKPLLSANLRTRHFVQTHSALPWSQRLTLDPLFVTRPTYARIRSKLHAHSHKMQRQGTFPASNTVRRFLSQTHCGNV